LEEGGFGFRLIPGAIGGLSRQREQEYERDNQNFHIQMVT